MVIVVCSSTIADISPIYFGPFDDRVDAQMYINMSMDEDDPKDSWTYAIEILEEPYED